MYICIYFFLICVGLGEDYYKRTIKVFGLIDQSLTILCFCFILFWTLPHKQSWKGGIIGASYSWFVCQSVSLLHSNLWLKQLSQVLRQHNKTKQKWHHDMFCKNIKSVSIKLEVVELSYFFYRTIHALPTYWFKLIPVSRQYNET